MSGTSLSVVAIPEVRGRIVTNPDGRLLRRVGSDNIPLIGDALGRFVREREERAAEAEPVFGFDLEGVDIELVNRALQADGRPKATRRNLMRALVDLGVAQVAHPPLDAHLVRAGVLLFAREPASVVPAATVQVVRRVGVGPGPGRCLLAWSSRAAFEARRGRPARDR